LLDTLIIRKFGTFGTRNGSMFVGGSVGNSSAKVCVLNFPAGIGALARRGAVRRLVGNVLPVLHLATIIRILSLG
jgi:hypothetical protein